MALRKKKAQEEVEELELEDYEEEAPTNRMAVSNEDDDDLDEEDIEEQFQSGGALGADAKRLRSAITSNDAVWPDGKPPKNGSVVMKKNGDLLGRIVYKKKPGVFGGFKKPDYLYIPPSKKNLYVLTETVKMGMVQYLHENKMEVCQLEDEAGAILDSILFEEDPSRLIILDYGRGTFLDGKNIEDIEGLIETFIDISDDCWVTIFSNTASFKTTISKKFAKNKHIMSRIDMHKFAGAVHVYEVLKEKNEVYPNGGAVDISPENVLTYKGIEIFYSDEQKQAIQDTSQLRQFLRDHPTYLFKDTDTVESEEGLPGYA